MIQNYEIKNIYIYLFYYMMGKNVKCGVCLIIPNLFDSELQEKLRNILILYYSMMETGFIFI